MSNFRIYRNISKNSKEYPYLINVQSSILSDLNSRLVIPVIKKELLKEKIKILNPEITINNEAWIVLTQQMSSISLSILGEEIEDVEMDRSTILSAIDFLITGF